MKRERKRERPTDGACNSRPSNNKMCVRTHSSIDNNNRKVDEEKKETENHTRTFHSRYMIDMNDACCLNSQIFGLYDRSSFAQ